MKEDDAAVAKLNELTTEATSLWLSSLSVVEIGYGLESNEQRNEFEALLEDIDIALLEKEEAKHTTRILIDLKEEGKEIDKIDSMIAATAIQRNTGVLTRNIKEFKRVKELKAIPY